MRRVSLVVDLLVLVGGYLAAAAVLTMMLLVTVDVLMRALSGGGTGIAVEVSGYLLVMTVFLGLGYTQRERGHISVDFFRKMLPARAQDVLDLLGTALFLWLALYLGYRGWQAMLVSYRFGSTSRTGLDIIVWPFQAVIPIGLFLLSLLLAVQLVQGLRRLAAGDRR